MADPLDASQKKRGGLEALEESPSKWARQDEDGMGGGTSSITRRAEVVVEPAESAENEEGAKENVVMCSSSTTPSPASLAALLDSSSTSNTSHESLNTIGMQPDEMEKEEGGAAAAAAAAVAVAENRPIRAYEHDVHNEEEEELTHEQQQQQHQQYQQQQQSRPMQQGVVDTTPPSSSALSSSSSRPQRQRQQQQQQQQPPQFNTPQAPRMDGVDHWLLMQRLKGVDPSLLLLSLLDDAGLALTMPLSAMSQDTQWTLIRRLVLRDQMNYRKKLRHVNTLDDVVGLIQKSRRILILTGAGLSVACGIPDFRSENGIYARLGEYNLPDPQSMFDMAFFQGNPKPFFEFARELLPGNYRPSVSHRFITELERRSKLLRCYTQNIDGNYRPSVSHRFITELERQSKLLRWYTQSIDSLELVAGLSQDKLLQCHGSFETATCLDCRQKFKLDEIRDTINKQRVPLCPYCCPDQDESTAAAAGGLPLPPSLPEKQKGLIKPDIIFFGESLGDRFTHAMDHDKQRVDLFLVLGSSLKVGPVNKILQWLPERVPQILINREVVGAPNEFDVELLGDCDAVINEIWKRLGWKEEEKGGREEGGEEGRLEGGREEGGEFEQPNRYYFVNGKRPVEDEDEEDEDEEDEVEGEEEEEQLQQQQQQKHVRVAFHHEGETEGEEAAVEAEEEEALRREEEDWEVGEEVVRPAAAAAAAAGKKEEQQQQEEEEEAAAMEEEEEEEEDEEAGASGTQPSTNQQYPQQHRQHQQYHHHHNHLLLFSPLSAPQSPALTLELQPLAPPALLSPLGSPLLSPSPSSLSGGKEEGKALSHECKPQGVVGSSSATPSSFTSSSSSSSSTSTSAPLPMSPRSNSTASTPRGGMMMLGGEGGREGGREGEGKEGGGSSRLEELEWEEFYLP